MDKCYIVTSASVIDGGLRCNGFFARETYEEAIMVAQDSIAADFGYDSWNEYLTRRDPEITEKNGVYTIYDDNCGHEESYKIEAFTG